jgi:hypothetical protein
MKKANYLLFLCILLTTEIPAAEHDIKGQVAVEECQIVLRDELIKAIINSLQVPIVIIDIVTKYCLEEKEHRTSRNSF